MAGEGSGAICLNIRHLDDVIDVAIGLKKICLLHNAQMLIIQDLDLAAKVNSDGIVLNFDDNYFAAREVLGQEKMIRVFASSIDQIADLNDAAIIDFILLGDYDSCNVIETPIISHQGIQKYTR